MTKPLTSPTHLRHPSPLTPLRLDDIERSEWDRLLGLTSAATPFARWTVHRAWWDAYGPVAEPHYLVIGSEPAIGIVPLMSRPARSASEREIYFAASYHADYATVLAADADLAAVAEAAIGHFAHIASGTPGLRAIDLRRFHAGDHFLGHLERAAGARASVLGWTIRREQEDVCPVLALAGDWHAQLARLGKKARHETRRKLRRAGAQGPVLLRYLPLDQSAVSRFIELHQARWGSAGLFADGEDGERSRVFLQRLVELEGAEGPDARLHVGEVLVGDRPVYVLMGFASGGSCYFYNAGMDPAASWLSPGALGVALYLRDRIEAGDSHFDFLRGDEPYKYAWGAADKPLYRLVIEPAARP